MAKLKSKEAFTLKTLDLSTLKGSFAKLFDNVFEPFKGRKYEDVLVLRDQPNSFDNEDATGANFGGKGFRLNPDDSAAAGRVQAIEGEAFGFKPFFLTGLDIPLRKIDAAISTKSFADDRKIWKQAFKGNDKIILSDQADSMSGFAGNDVMRGKAGDDTLKGGGGDDRIKGGTEDDTLKGGSGNDLLEGEDGFDLLNGGGGDDFLDGGENDDILKGGRGADIFYFSFARTDVTTSNTDTVHDFTIGTDRIQVDTGKTDVNGWVDDKGRAVVAYSDGQIIFEGLTDFEAIIAEIEFL